MNTLKADDLEWAITSGGRIDCAHLILGAMRVGGWKRRSIRRPRRISPFLVPAYLIEDFNALHPSRSELGYREFERLSLAARAGLFLKAGDWPDFRKEHLEDAVKTLSLDLDEMAEVEPAEIQRVLAWAAAKLAPTAAADDEAVSRRLPGFGLQLVGCRIRSRSGDHLLDLSNAKLPLSVSFVGCLFDGPLMLNDSEFISVDLSGCAMPGLEASGLRTRGDVHLRRATILSPVRLSSARIGGLLDASDILVAPMIDVPANQVVDADHGMLNLSQAIVENEIHLDRARIWGGLSLRGATARRSLFLNGAIVASPMAVLEKWAYDLSRNDTAKPETIISAAGDRIATSAEHRSLAHLHNTNWPQFKRHWLPSREKPKIVPVTISESKLTALRNIENLQGIARCWDATVLHDLLTESLRARVNAIRADGLTVHGTIFAEDMFASGRIRMKYSQVFGSMQLGGVVLHSGYACRTAANEAIKALNTVKLEEYYLLVRGVRTLTGSRFKGTTWFPQNFALDLRGSFIQGDLSFRRGEHSELGGSATESGEPAAIHGVLGLDGLRLDGSLIATEARFKWRPSGLDSRAADWPDKAKLEAQVAKWQDDKRAEKAEPMPPPPAKDGVGAHAIRLRQAQVGRDIDLRESHDLWGIDLEDAKVGGSLRFSSKSHGTALPSGWIECRRRAHNVLGQINLRGARIDGDSFLVFNPDRGPDINAELAAIDGRLDIYPARESKRFHVEPVKPKDPSKGIDDAARPEAFAWGACQHRRREAKQEVHCAKCMAVLEARLDVEGRPRREWFVNLRHAKATVFAHPPIAWPHPQALSLDGFKYDRSSSLGPLPPLPLDIDPSDVAEANSSRFERLVVPTLAVLTAVAALTAGLAWLAHAAASRTGFSLAPDLTAITTFAVSGLTVIYLSSLFPPSRRDARPLAVDYLARHRTDANRFQHKGTPYSPLDPYSTASQALREAGRYISANEVEKARLKRRVQMLSLRHHGPVKMGLKFVGLLSGYGFELDRLVKVMFAVLVFTAVLAYSGASLNWLEPATPFLPATCQEDRAYCPSFLYATDILTPFLDLKQDVWRVSETMIAGVENPLARSTLRALPNLFQLLGAILFGVLGTALAARVEAAFARVRE